VEKIQVSTDFENDAANKLYKKNVFIKRLVLFEKEI